MATSKINRFNMHQLPPYERMQHQRERRAAVAEMVAKNAGIANSFASIQVNTTREQGNLISKVAMGRMSKTV